MKPFQQDYTPAQLDEKDHEMTVSHDLEKRHRRRKKGFLGWSKGGWLANRKQPLVGGLCITIIRVGKHPTCTGDRLPDVSQGPEVGFLGLMSVFPKQCVRDLILKVRLQ